MYVAELEDNVIARASGHQHGVRKMIKRYFQAMSLFDVYGDQLENQNFHKIKVARTSIQVAIALIGKTKVSALIHMSNI